MNIIGISGSPKNKRTDYMIKTILDATGKEYELVKLYGKKVGPCIDCDNCKNPPYNCAIEDDMQELSNKLINAEAIVLGSPTYFDNVSGVMKIFIDRMLAFYYSRKLKGRKVAIVAVGFEDAKSVKQCVHQMEGFCKLLGMNIVGSIYATHNNVKAKEKALKLLGKKLSEK